MERWPSGLRRTLGKRVSVNSASWVRIPLSSISGATLRCGQWGLAQPNASNHGPTQNPDEPNFLSVSGAFVQPQCEEGATDAAPPPAERLRARYGPTRTAC